MSADKDRAIRRQKQKRAKCQKKEAKKAYLPAGAAAAQGKPTTAPSPQ